MKKFIHTIIILLSIIVLYFLLSMQMENNNTNNEYKIVLPEEINLAKTNDALYIDRITIDSIYLGFRKYKPLLKTEYEIEILNQTQVKIYNGSEVQIIHIDSIQSYLRNDNL